ncbi:MAG TPA: VOC family protein [Candidatus Limnocylindrales bacterium]
MEDDPDNAGAMLEPPAEDLPRLFFQRVPEGKVAKNRVHLDLKVGGGRAFEERKERIDAEAARLVALGASDHRGPIAEGGSYWMRMNDPEGNEFCIVRG